MNIVYKPALLAGFLFFMSSIKNIENILKSFLLFGNKILYQMCTTMSGTPTAILEAAIFDNLEKGKTSMSGNQPLSLCS
jgi:hypothetical protein